MRLSKVAVGGAVAVAFSVFLPALTAHAIGNNLVVNPSVETAGTAGQPANWTFNSWGTNTVTSSWKAGGKDGAKSLAVAMTARTSGDAKWMSAPITVKPGTQYQISDWYIGSVQTSLELVFTTAAGAQSFAWLADAPVSAAWKQLTFTFTTPANAAKVSIYHVLAKKGSLQTDAYSLAEVGAQPSPTATTPRPTTAAPTTPPPTTRPPTTTPPATTPPPTTRPPTTTPPPTTPAPTTPAPTTPAPTTPPPTTAPPTPGNLIPNPSVETAAGTVPAGWSADRWGTNTTAFTYPNTGRTGSRSVRTDITAYSSGDAKWHPAPVTVTPGLTYQYSNWYQSNVDTEVDVEVTMANGTIQYAYLTTATASASWAKISAQYIAPAGATKITVFQVIAKKGWLVGDDFSLAPYTPAKFTRAMVSLTFDDGWLSQYTSGVPLLDTYNMDATFYLLTSTIAYPDYMTQAQMGDLANHGHEIASHTVTHPHLTTLTAAQVDGELKNSQASLRTWYGPTVSKNFATPYGEYNATVLSKSKLYYRSHRSTDEGFNTKDGTDFYNIRVQNILNTTTPAQVGLWVDQAMRDNSWLVLVYHEVSAGAEDPTYAVTPANLDAELRIIRDKGITVRTVDQALTEIQPQL